MRHILRLLLCCFSALLCLRAAGTADAEGTRLEFPNGTEVASSAEYIDLSTLSHGDVDAALPLLEQMDNLRHIDLGADRAMTAFEREGTPLPAPELVWTEGYTVRVEIPARETEDERLSWADVRRIVEAVPDAEVEYRFHISDQPFSTLSESMDLNHIVFDDEGALIRQILPCMQRLKVLDMDFCGVSSEKMAEIRETYPAVDVIWRIWFGPERRLSVRTDAERVLASSIDGLTDLNIGELRYCTKVKYLDIGHSVISDLSFIRPMRDLEVLILSLTRVRDLSPITGLDKLEFFEFGQSFGNGGYDLSPIGSCVNLRHVNICCLGEVTGYETLVNLTKLERLWIGCTTYLPDEWIEKIRLAAPQAEINTTETTGCAGTWRYTGVGYVPRYELLREQFDYDNFQTAVALCYNDPKYGKPNRDT